VRVEWIFSFGAGIEIVGGAFLAFGLPHSRGMPEPAVQAVERCQVDALDA
jgi:hypothetical protein